MTSNIGAKELDISPVGFSTETDEDMNISDVITKALKNTFRPEFINRIDEKVVFKTLTEDNISEIVDIHIKKLENRMNERGNYKLSISKKMKKFLLKESYNEEYGARPVIRAITKYIQNPASKSVLKGDIKEGDTIFVDYNEKNDEIIVKKKK